MAEKIIATKMQNKTILVTFLLVIIVIFGFMLKLPKMFRNYDKELHFLFYFYISFLVSLFFVKNKLTHFFIAILCLSLFGVFIEYLQEYSNSFFRKRIHGSFDKEDLKYNLMGLSLFNSLWLINYFLYKIKLFRHEETS
jgi:VanZ family protein